LVSSVYELEDTEAKVEKRLSARQKIQAFLIKVAAKLPDAAIGVLQAYVEKKLGL
jgi:hypothetical protein